MKLNLWRVFPAARLAVVLTLTILTLASGALAQYTETTLYDFTGKTDGGTASSAMVLDASGNVFGTAFSGGNSACFAGCGTVFELSPSSTGWTYHLLYSFTGGSDGAYPNSLIADASGNLFGTASAGAAKNTNCTSGCGTVFELSPASSGWTFSVLYTFSGGSDGGKATGLVFGAGSSLFGSATVGGPADWGLVFQLTPTSTGWAQSVLHNFSGHADGGFPGYLLFDAAGNLYGAAEGGSGSNKYCGQACGNIFRLAPTGGGWGFSLLYVFEGPGGGIPTGSLAFDASGNLYGSAERGGKTSSRCAIGGGCGVVFELTPTTSGYWKETVLHSFTQGYDGAKPVGGVTLDASGNLFGTTFEGTNLTGGDVFELSPAADGGRIFVRLYDFDALADGFQPQTPLTLDASGNLFGATSTGGGFMSLNCNSEGCGSVFELSPPAGSGK